MESNKEFIECMRCGTRQWAALDVLVITCKGCGRCIYSDERVLIESQEEMDIKESNFEDD